MYTIGFASAIATTVSYCDRTLILLNSAPLKFLRLGVRCQVQLISNALAWGQSELPKMTQEELQQEFLALPAVDGKKAPAWVARVNELMRGTVLVNQR